MNVGVSTPVFANESAAPEWSASLQSTAPDVLAQNTSPPNATVEGVTAVLTKQSDAWNRGDLDTFMTGYVKSADTSYVSGGTEVWGYEALRDRYQRKYGNSRDSMGKLSFANLRIIELGDKNALCIGHWHLDRAQESPLDGIFSLVLMRSAEGWKIMHDHTSLSETK